MIRFFLFLCLFLFSAVFSAADAKWPLTCRKIQTPDIRFQFETKASGLEYPWGLAFLPNGALLVTERTGKLRILSEGKLSPPVRGVPKVDERWQGGLMDVVLDPKFSENRFIYLSFAEPLGSLSGTAIFKAKLIQNKNRYSLTDGKVIFSASKKTRSNLHYGSRMVFSKDGKYLFATLGERGNGKRAQDPKDHAGSIIRIQPDGSAPKDNPFASGKSWLPEIFSIGHRNPQGIGFHPTTGELYTVAHGARGGDELNVIRPGKNYGWPVITYGIDYSGAKIGIGTESPGLEQPLYYWDPSIAPSGLAFYDPPNPKIPSWKGGVLISALKDQMLVRLFFEGDCVFEERYFEGEFGRIRGVFMGPKGAVWILTDQNNGKIIRITERL